MPLPLHVPKPPRLALLVLCLLGACGGADEDGKRVADLLLRRGDLEGARKVLLTLNHPDAEAMSSLVNAELAVRVKLESDLLALELTEVKLAAIELESMLVKAEDKWTKNRLELELSRLVDRAAVRGGKRRLKAPKPPSLDELREREQQRLVAEAQELAEQREQVEQEALQRIQAMVEEGLPTGSERVPEKLGEPTWAALTAKVTVEAESEAEPEAEPEAAPKPDPGPKVPEATRVALEQAEAQLVSATVPERDAALDQLIAVYKENDFFLRRALRQRWSQALEELQQAPGYDEFEALSDLHKDLGRSRKGALDLIFDEVRYFYPYERPACPPDKAATYGPVQLQVENQVEGLEKIWKDGRVVKVTARLWGAAEELQWQKLLGLRIPYYPSLPGGLPSGVLWIEGPEQELTIRNFVSNKRQRVAQAYDRVVAAYNREWWAEGANMGLNDSELAGPDEQELITITNEYRRMFGRPSMAWNPLLQLAAGGHSAYMERMGEVTHAQEDEPTKRSPFDRMHLVGYNYGASENISNGFVSAAAAFWSWSHSSAHHRNLLKTEHTELGSARAGVFWTQNFGAGLDFQSELDKWQD
jgi:uncharacterized protein YkwD